MTDPSPSSSGSDMGGNSLRRPQPGSPEEEPSTDNAKKQRVEDAPADNLAGRLTEDFSFFGTTTSSVAEMDSNVIPPEAILEAELVAELGETLPELDPQRPQPRRKRADKPHFATREAEYMEARQIECVGKTQLKQNETIVTANYYPLSFLNGSRFASDIQFHRFDVEFRPFVARIHRRHVIEEFNKQHFKEISLGFDGNTLCFALASAVEKTELGRQEFTKKMVVYGRNNSMTTEVQMRRTTISGPVKAEDGTAFLQAINTCVKKALCQAFKLKVFKDVLWDLKTRDEINCKDRQGQTQKYELVRGYDITVKPAQTGFYLIIDDTSRIFKQGSVFEWMNSTRKSNPDDYQRIIEDRLRNSILYNMIGNELIRVAAVHFDRHPASYMFKWRRGTGDQATEEEISIQTYYKQRYNQEVAAKQPLLETVPLYKLKPNATDEEKKQYEMRKNLIPGDLCLFTGLDQAEKSNFQLMKQINERTKPLAMRKKLDLDDAVRKYLLGDAVKKEMSGMQMKLDVNEKNSAYGLSVALRARIIQPPMMNFGTGRNGTPSISSPGFVDGKNGPAITFERQVRECGPVHPHPEDFSIAIITTSRDKAAMMTFFETLRRAAAGMVGNLLARPPKVFEARSPKVADFSTVVEECCQLAQKAKRVPFMFVLVPDELKERYDQVKQVSLLNYGFLSQVLRARTISSPNMSVATKVMMQVAAKMGTVNWALNAPAIPELKSLMSSALIVGLDVHHDGERRGSVQAVVGTLDHRASIFYQRSRLVGRGEEISTQSSGYSMYIKDMITERSNKNISTGVIVIYRDGVSEGQIETALTHEYEPLKQALADWVKEVDCPYNADKIPKIIFVFVMKRHSTRFFQFNEGGDTNMQSAGYDGGGRGGRGGGGGSQKKKFENPIPGTVVSRGIVRSDRAEFYLASHDTKEGCICPMRYEILRNETLPPTGMSSVEAAAKGYAPVRQETIEDLTFYLTALYPNQCATIRLPVVCQLAQKFAMLSGQHLHQDAVDLQQNLRKKMFYL